MFCWANNEHLQHSHGRFPVMQRSVYLFICSYKWINEKRQRNEKNGERETCWYNKKNELLCGLLSFTHSLSLSLLQIEHVIMYCVFVSLAFSLISHFKDRNRKRELPYHPEKFHSERWGVWTGTAKTNRSVANQRTHTEHNTLTQQPAHLWEGVWWWWKWEWTKK